MVRRIWQEDETENMEQTYERASDPWLGSFRELFQAGMHVLDLGCGMGEDSADLLSYSVRVTAVDKSVERIAIAGERAPEAEFVVADILDLPFEAGSFDIVVASLCLHYFDLATTKSLARDISQALKPGGTLICRVNRVGDVNFHYGKGREIEPDFFEVSPGRFKRFFSEEVLREVLEAAFEVQFIRPETTTRWGSEKLVLVAQARRPLS